jgi:hypothetical protein
MKITNTIVPSENPIAGPVLGIAASMMAGWTVLLAWASFKPVKRRAVLLFTAVPVITGLFSVALTGYLDSPGSTLWVLIKLIILFAAMLWAFVTARRIDKGGRHEH